MRFSLFTFWPPAKYTYPGRSRGKECGNTFRAGQPSITDIFPPSGRVSDAPADVGFFGMASVSTGQTQDDSNGYPSRQA
jgi:hypothetical protein